MHDCWALHPHRSKNHLSPADVMSLVGKGLGLALVGQLLGLLVCVMMLPHVAVVVMAVDASIIISIANVAAIVMACVGLYLLVFDLHYVLSVCAALSLAYWCSALWVGWTLSAFVGGCMIVVAATMRRSWLLFPKFTVACDGQRVKFVFDLVEKLENILPQIKLAFGLNAGAFALFMPTTVDDPDPEFARIDRPPVDGMVYNVQLTGMLCRDCKSIRRCLSLSSIRAFVASSLLFSLCGWCILGVPWGLSVLGAPQSSRVLLTKLSPRPPQQQQQRPFKMVQQHVPHWSPPNFLISALVLVACPWSRHTKSSPSPLAPRIVLFTNSS